MTEPTPVQTAEHQITIERVFDAPRELVFQAWTDPDHLTRWFGPAGIDTPRESIAIDLRVGGRLTLTMVKRDSGREYRLGYEIVELVEPELLVLRADPVPEAGIHHDTVTRVELRDEDGTTRMTLTDGPYAEPGGAGAEDGWQSSFDRLATTLAG